MRAFLMLTVAAALHSMPAGADCIAPTFVSPHLEVPQEPQEEAFGTGVVGGVQWTDAPNPDCSPVVFDVRADFDAAATPIDVEVLHVGPRRMAWRVPQLPVDSIIGSTQECEGTRLVSTPVFVTEGQPVVRDPPTLEALTVTGTESFDTTGDCEDTLHIPDLDAVTRFTATLFSADVAPSDAPLLVDAWLVAEGEDVPGETEERAADAVPAVIENDALLIRTRRGGPADLVVRVIDRDTALISSEQRVSFVNPFPELVGCTCSTSSAADSSLWIATLFVLLVARRRASAG